MASNHVHQTRTPRGHWKTGGRALNGPYGSEDFALQEVICPFCWSEITPFFIRVLVMSETQL